MPHAIQYNARMDTTTNATPRTAPAFVVVTQMRENYGAHSWDGTGACPQYWKCKGGHDYFVHGAETAEQAAAAAEAVLPCNDYYEEYIIAISPYSEWESRLPEWYEHRDLVLSCVIHIERGQA